jgi:hypothetical protein
LPPLGRGNGIIGTAQDIPESAVRPEYGDIRSRVAVIVSDDRPAGRKAEIDRSKRAGQASPDVPDAIAENGETGRTVAIVIARNRPITGRAKMLLEGLFDVVDREVGLNRKNVWILPPKTRKGNSPV